MHAITLSIGDIAVRQLNGLFSLNDLHKAAGGEAKHQPALFMRMEQTQALIAEIGNSTDSQSFKTKEGRNGGTYACRELVIAYAAWISAAFHLKVIRVFLDATTGRPYNPAIDYTRVSPAEKQAIRKAVAARAGKNKLAYAAIYEALHRRFDVNSYHELPAESLQEALTLVNAINPSDWEVMDEPTHPQPTAFTQGLNAARDNAMGYFNAVRSGQVNARLEDIPTPVLEGIVADSLTGKRFLAGYDLRTGQMQVQLVPRDTALFSPQAGSFQELIHAIPMERLPELQNAMTQRMLTELGTLRRHVAMQA